AVVLVPLYGCSPSSPRWSQNPDARLSLACLLATWRAGGVAAPVTPALLRAPADPLGLSPAPPASAELPVALTQWVRRQQLRFRHLLASVEDPADAPGASE
ncbi:unnamed protein product, partial [Prorocentrum cordatum]